MAGMAIIGHGARTPLGLDCRSSAAAVRAGISAIADHPFMIDRFGQPMKVTRDPGLDEDWRCLRRVSALAAAAAQEALAGYRPATGLPEGLAEGLAVMLNLGEPRPGLPAGSSAEVARHLRAALKLDAPIHHAMEGHAGGIAAMEAADRLLDSGRAKAVLVGGAESYLDADTLEWLDSEERLHSENNIYGFCPGEGAAFILLAKHDQDAAMEIAATGLGREANLRGTENICLGEGLGAAFAALRDGPADRIICDMNGERYRGNEYGFAALRSHTLFHDAADFEAPADCWGDVGAASAPLFACLAIEAEVRGYAKGPCTLIWASSARELRGAALLRRQENA
jgi:3-oxoacyl-[acyl-carrier-protein] synthase-1